MLIALFWPFFAKKLGKDGILIIFNILLRSYRSAYISC